MTPPALYRRLYRGEQVSQGSPYQPLSPTEYSPLPELVKDAGRATRSGARHDRLTSVPRKGDAAEKTLTVTERRYADTRTLSASAVCVTAHAACATL